jgi:hypothetical protein
MLLITQHLKNRSLKTFSRLRSLSTSIWAIKVLPANAIIFTSVLIFTANCKKSAPNFTLPETTQEGKNTFGFEINGRVWIPYYKCADVYGGVTELIYYTMPSGNSGGFPITFAMLAANNIIDEKSIFDIRYRGGGLINIYNTGNYFDSLQIHYSGGNSGIEYYNDVYATPVTMPYFNIDYIDTVRQIVSGKFAFTLYAGVGVNGVDSVVITNGRFDFKLQEVYSRCSN